MHSDTYTPEATSPPTCERKRIEEAFGWIKTIAGQARTRLRGVERVRWSFTLAAAAYNLIRLPRLIEATP